MYNEEQKQKYIDEKLEDVKINKYYLPSLFRRSEPFEEQLGKDISTFTTSEIENMYKMMNRSSVNSLLNDNYNYGMYTNWCLTNLRNVPDSQNHFLEFNAKRITSIVDRFAVYKKYFSKQDIDDWCAGLANPMDRFMLRALFEGIRGSNCDEIWRIREADVDTVKNTINIYKRGVHSYSPELCRDAMESAHTFVYYTKNGKGRGIKFCGADQADEFTPEDNYVIKQYGQAYLDDDFRKGRRVYTGIAKIFKMLGATEPASPAGVYTAGLINMLKEGSEKHKMPVAEYAEKYLDEINNRYDRFNIKSKARYVRMCEVSLE